MATEEGYELVSLYYETASAHSAYCAAIMKHLIFMRHQIECPWDEFANFVHRDSKPKNQAKQRKKIALIDGVHGAFEAISQCLRFSYTIFEIGLVFGNVLVHPKEIYLIKTSDLQVADLEAGDPTPLIRQLIAKTPQSFYKKLQSTSLYLMVRAVPQLAHPLFIPKIGFKLPLHKKCSLTVFELKSMQRQLPDTNALQPSEWFLYSTVMRGIKSAAADSRFDGGSAI